jgi:hypothetical protein
MQVNEGRTMVTFGAVKEREYTLLEQGEYVLTLSELEESEGQWGDRMIWKFLVAPKEDYSAYICKPDGKEYLLWAFTDCDIILGSMAHEFAQTLSGRKLDKDDAPPDEDDLLGKKMIAYVTHETPTRGKNAGKKREAIVAGSIKPFRVPMARNGASKNAPPVEAPDEGDRELIVTTLKKRVARLLKLDKENGQKAQEALEASELDTAPLADLERLSDAVAESITAALDA